MKTILILTAGFGEGHNSAARNLSEALIHLGGEQVRVEVLDLFETAYPHTNGFSRRLYISAINKTPRLWQSFYKLLDRPRLFERTLFAFAPLEKVLAKTLAEKKPAAVCCTYPAYNYLIERLVKRGMARDYLHLTVVTDSISINSLWYRAPSDYFVVPNSETLALMEKAGVPTEKMKVFGFPVQLDFALPERRCIPLDPAVGRPKVLYIINSGKAKAPELVRRLLAHEEIDLSIAVGRDEKLTADIREICKGQEHRVELIGWTSRMPQLLMSHHLVITKAGGATTQEAIAAECPPIFNQVVPGQEEGNWELVRRADGGALAEQPADTAEWVKKALENNGTIWRQWNENLHKINRPESALTAARFILEKI